MTGAAARFVGPLTFAALTGNPVRRDLFDPAQEAGFSHLDLARWADAVVVAPATANIIGKAAQGIADDFLSTVLMAATSPVLVCPAMNQAMYKNPALQANLERLKERGVVLVGPAAGELACGEEGEGRLADLGDITAHLERALSPGPLAGRRVVVTAGPTREFMDPVRFISNPSTGKMGFALAHAAWVMGADVTLITGPSRLSAPEGIEVTRVTTAAQMRDEVESAYGDADALVMASAVSDFRPVSESLNKVKKDKAPPVVEFAQNPDILAALGARKGSKVLVGFAAESQDLVENAREKLKRKNLDIIVANDITDPDSGFGADTNLVTILDSTGEARELPLMSKAEVAALLMERVAGLLEEKRGGGS